MKIGFNLLLWTTHVTDEHFRLFDDLARAGYDGVEVPIFEGHPHHYAGLKSRLDQAGLKATSVGVVPDASVSPISADAATRESALDHLKWLIDCSEALGAEVLCGPFHSPLGEFSGQGPTDAEHAACTDVHRRAAEYARPSRLKLSVEPLNRFECYFMNTAEAGQRMVRSVGMENYGYLWDSFHFNIEEKDLPESIASTFSTINHVHISENDRGTPGQGHIEFQPIFDTLRRYNYDGWLTIEAFGSALPDLAAATKVWRPFFRTEREVFEDGYRMIRAGWDKAK